MRGGADPPDTAVLCLVARIDSQRVRATVPARTRRLRLHGLKEWASGWGKLAPSLPLLGSRHTTTNLAPPIG